MIKKQSTLGIILNNRIVLCLAFLFVFAVGCDSQNLRSNEKTCIEYIESLQSPETFKGHFFQLVRDGYCVIIVKVDSGSVVRSRVWFTQSGSNLNIDSSRIDQPFANPAEQDKFVETIKQYVTLCVTISQRFKVRDIGGIDGDGKYIVFTFADGRRLFYSPEKTFPSLADNARLKMIATKSPFWVLQISNEK